MGCTVGSSPSRRTGGMVRPAVVCGLFSTGNPAPSLRGALARFGGTAAASSTGPALTGGTGSSLATGMGKTLALGFRIITFLSLFTLAAALVLPRTGFLTLLMVLLLRALPVARLAFRRGVFG